MKEKGTRKKEFRVGLDIGTRLIKILELSKEGGIQRISKFQFSEIDPPATNENTARVLKMLLESFKPATKEVSISLSAPSAIVRFINMPKMTEEDLKNSLQFEAEKYIPFNINEVIIDASILEQLPEEENQVRVLLAAAKKDAVNTKIETLKALGFSVSLIDIDGFACFNAFCSSFDNLDESKSVALLNIGYSQTNVLISRGRQPFFTRDIQIGARDIAKAISRDLQIEAKESDKLIVEPKDKAAQIFEIAKSILSNLVDELRLSFGYYENQYGRAINEIYISGGVARLGGIADYLEENFGVKPSTWNPFSKFEIGQDIDAKLLEIAQPQFAVCAGLAVRK